MKKLQALHKEYCEIEGCPQTDPSVLDYHHIIERTEVGTSNHPLNCAVLCAVHHRMVHAGRLKILNVFPGTKPPTGRIVVYELDGICNIPTLKDAKPYFNYRPEQIKI